MSQKFYPIKVKEVSKSTKDCTIVTLDVPEDLKNTFSYSQGQHLTFKRESDGEEIRRSYSLCSSPLDNEWKVAVKKIAEGKFSTFVNSKLKAGDIVEVMPPHGSFFKEPEKDAGKNYVAFAAGSGITPIYSIIKTHLKLEPHSSFTLFYINRQVSSIILKEEVENLKNSFIRNFEVYHFLTREERDSPLFNGRLSVEKLEEVNGKLIDFSTVDDFFLCGPAEMIFMLRDFLASKKVSKERIHFELFNAPVSSEKKPKKENASNEDVCDVTIINNGTKISFDMPQNDDNILDAALRNNADLPFACKGGVCCTCRAKVMEGDVEMEVNYALEPEEVEEGYVLTCQSIPKSKKVVVDFDQ